MAERKKRKKIYTVILIIIVFAAVLAALFYDSNTRIVVTEYNIEVKNLPQSFDGFKIAQVSDLHEKVFKNDNSELYSKISAEKPDLIAITGDMVDAAGYEDYVIDTVARLSEIAPVYYVTGNHEWAAGDAKGIIDAVYEGGGRPLRNEYVKIYHEDGSLLIAGIDDPNGPYDQKTVSQLSDEITAKEGDVPSVLLAHRNDPDRYQNLSFDVILCGHAHGGVWRLPFLGGLLSTERTLFPKYTAGIADLDCGKLVISRGIGNGNDVPRFLNNPEIPIIILNCP